MGFTAIVVGLGVGVIVVVVVVVLGVISNAADVDADDEFVVVNKGTS
jgi:hypothetical protein